MKIPDAVRKTIGFIGYEHQQTHEFVPAGSFFFLGHDPVDGSWTSPRVYAVTARHVISGLNSKAVQEVLLRLNPKDRSASLIVDKIPIDKWFVDPTDDSIDVAITEKGIPANVDHMVIAVSMCATDDKLRHHDVELGDEVFISGLFTHYYGNKRNIPIVRVGNLAALGEEKIRTKSFGEIVGYLVEARSTGGLSGSPVFLNLGPFRVISGQIKRSTSGSAICLLLGLVHGHFQQTNSIDGSEDALADATIRAINQGIAIVVPAKSILAVIDAFEKKPAS
jgi:hypothetical protein